MFSELQKSTINGIAQLPIVLPSESQYNAVKTKIITGIFTTNSQISHCSTGFNRPNSDLISHADKNRLWFWHTPFSEYLTSVYKQTIYIIFL